MFQEYESLTGSVSFSSHHPDVGGSNTGCTERTEDTTWRHTLPQLQHHSTVGVSEV